jgi:hypothetical protein
VGETKRKSLSWTSDSPLRKCGSKYRQVGNSRWFLIVITLVSCTMSGAEATQCAIHHQSWLHSTLHQLSIPLALMMGGIFDLLQPDAQGFHLQQPG